MSQLRVLLQDSLDRERGAITILALLREKMDGGDSIRGSRRRSLKERLGLNSMGCCGGATWGLRPNTVNFSDSEDEEQQESTDHVPDLVCSGRTPSISSGMNLAAALAAERHLRAADEHDLAGPTTTPTPTPTPNDNSESVVPAGTPLRVSLIRLLAETEGGDGVGDEKAGNDSLCCVCMGRKKGAAFIPCGHTFCRVCSREMWLNRGSCPLCNRSVLEILDIF